MHEVVEDLAARRFGPAPVVPAAVGLVVVAAPGKAALVLLAERVGRPVSTAAVVGVARDVRVASCSVSVRPDRDGEGHRRAERRVGDRGADRQPNCIKARTVT